MKTTDVFFKDTNFVGREIENVQDLVKALAAGMNIADADGNGYSGGYEVEDENGNYDWHDKTDEELFADMRADLDGGCELYAGYFLDCGMYHIIPNKATTLQSDFYTGQEVYTMRDNKIAKDKILYINLVIGKEGKENKYILYGAQGKYTSEQDIFATKEELVKSLLEG